MFDILCTNPSIVSHCENEGKVCTDFLVHNQSNPLSGYMYILLLVLINITFHVETYFISASLYYIIVFL